MPKLKPMNPGCCCGGSTPTPTGNVSCPDFPCGYTYPSCSGSSFKVRSIASGNMPVAVDTTAGPAHYSATDPNTGKLVLHPRWMTPLVAYTVPNPNTGAKDTFYVRYTLGCSWLASYALYYDADGTRRVPDDGGGSQGPWNCTNAPDPSNPGGFAGSVPGCPISTFTSNSAPPVFFQLLCSGGGGTSGGNMMAPRPHAYPASYAAALPASSSLRVGLVLDWMLLGGAEASMLAQVDALSALLGDAIAWAGAVAMNGPPEPGVLADYGALMPVVVGGVPAVRDLAARCDVLLAWSVLDYAALRAGMATPPKVVFECHLPSAWGPATADLLGSVEAFVAVSRYARDPIPPALAARSTVIWNAIDAARLAAPRSRAAVRSSWGIA